MEINAFVCVCFTTLLRACRVRVAASVSLSTSAAFVHADVWRSTQLVQSSRWCGHAGAEHSSCLWIGWWNRSQRLKWRQSQRHNWSENKNKIIKQKMTITFLFYMLTLTFIKIMHILIPDLIFLKNCFFTFFNINFYSRFHLLLSAVSIRGHHSQSSAFI